MNIETAEDWILQTNFGTPNPTSWDRKCLKRFDFWRHTKVRDEIYKFIFYFPSKTEIENPRNQKTNVEHVEVYQAFWDSNFQTKYGFHD